MGEADILVEDLAPLLARVPPAAARDFKQAGGSLCGWMERLLAADLVLAGEGGTGMFGSLRNDHRFLAGILGLNLAGLLVETLPWFYRTARGHGRPEDLPPRLFQHWVLAVTEALPPGSAGPVNAVLRWILGQHGAWTRLARIEPAPAGPGDSRWADLYDPFLAALVDGRQVDCLRLAEGRVRNAGDLGPFYTQVVTPAMREVGRRWEAGRLSVAHEHRASAVARRTCDALNHLLIPFQRRKGRILVTASPDEWHDLGARILADLLAGDGWEVDYLGANVPARDLAAMVRHGQHDVLAMSLTVPFNLIETRDLVGSLREEHGARAPRVIVGGGVAGQDPDLWRRLAADGQAGSAQEALAVLDGWWADRDRRRPGPAGPGR